MDNSKTDVIGNTVKSGKVTEFKCNYCSFKAVAEFLLTLRKTMKHSNEFQCGNCEYITYSENELNLHIEDCQSLDYKSKKCKFKCTTGVLLKRHDSQKH